MGDATDIEVADLLSPTSTVTGHDSDNITGGQVGPKKDESGNSSWILAKKDIEKWGHPDGLTIFRLSWCMIGLILDPIFLYIPTIDDSNKCIEMNKKLSIAAVTLRSLLDVPIFVSFIARSCIKISFGFKYDFDPDSVAVSDWLRRRRILTKTITHLIAFAKALLAIIRLFNFVEVILFLTILPVPQVAIVVLFFRMTPSGYFYKSAILNTFLLPQYLPKLFFMYVISSQDLILTRKWVKASFNLVQYICASHVLGAFWYFFSIQREITCWHQACRNTPGCTATYYCDHTSNSTNIKILNELCPINPENATLFDFGIYLDAFQSGSTGQRDFSTKLFYCLWWGIRNLSNFGTNLETSSYIWENCFAILISIIGLLLFLYFIGNVQTYIQLAVTKTEEINELQSKLTKKNPKLDAWMERHNLPLDIKEELFTKQNLHLKENIDVDVDVKGQLSILSGTQKYRYFSDSQYRTIVHFCMNTLKKVPILQKINEQVLEKICEYLTPVIYTENSYVVREGKPLGLMLFIIDGTIWTYKTNADNAAEKTETNSSSMMMIKWLEKGDFYGEQLLSCCRLPNCSLSHLPISTENVQCQTKVEAFALMAKDLRNIVSEPWWDLSTPIEELAPPCDTIDHI